MDGADHGALNSDAGRQWRRVDAEDDGDGGGRRQGRGDIGNAAVFTDRIKGNTNGPILFVCLGGSVGDGGAHSIGPRAIVDHDIALGRVQQRVHKGSAAAGDDDERVDVGQVGELESKGADGGGAAVDDQRRRLRGWVPGQGQVEALVQAEAGRESG